MNEDSYNIKIYTDSNKVKRKDENVNINITKHVGTEPGCVANNILTKVINFTT